MLIYGSKISNSLKISVKKTLILVATIDNNVKELPSAYILPSLLNWVRWLFLPRHGFYAEIEMAHLLGGCRYRCVRFMFWCCQLHAWSGGGRTKDHARTTARYFWGNLSPVRESPISQGRKIWLAYLESFDRSQHKKIDEWEILDCYQNKLPVISANKHFLTQKW